MADSCANNKVTTSVNHAIIEGAPGGVPGPAGPPGCPTLSRTSIIEEPTSGRAYLGYFNNDAVISKIIVVLRGNSPSVTMQLSHGVSFSGVADASLFASQQTIASVSSGAKFTTSDFVAGSNAVDADHHMWVNFSAVSIGVEEVAITVVYKASCDPIVIQGEGGAVDNAAIRINNSEGVAGYLPIVENPNA